MPHVPTFLADSPWLDQLLVRLPAARVAVFGDLCLDAYWFLADAPSECSLETGLDAHKVHQQRYSPGGAGNVAANLAALGVSHIETIGVVGADPFGDELRRQLAARGLSLTSVNQGPAGWPTLAYAKPYRAGVEMNRFDFGAAQPLGGETLAAVIACLTEAARTCRVIVINQQVPQAWSDEVAPALNRLIAAHPQVLFIVDSRDHARDFSHVALKLNLREAARLLGESAESLGPEDALRLAHTLEARQRQPIFLTRGEHGLVLAVRGELYDIPGIELPGAIDSVGAGDTALAALAAAFAVDADPLEAGTLANLAAAITTRKLRTTGTATPAELRSIGPAPDYIYAPRLALQPRLARYCDHTHLELVSGRVPARPFRHAIFDHDGTLSVLRQGWEAIMEPMMVRAILGIRAATIDDAQHARVTATVRAFIDRTTGIQTLAQMKGLAELVREFGFVPEADVLNEQGYKAIYNDALLGLVRSRRAQLDRGELSPEDWQIKNAQPLLDRLRAAGVTLYLASGTDETDVAAEARALGYADLFTGGIFGAVGDLKIEAKRDVLLRIVSATGAPAEEIVVFGDGPVEMREGRKRGAYTVGLATDEVRRHGIDPRKRTRLIRAGADVVVPDFSQLDTLLDHLRLN